MWRQTFQSAINPLTIIKLKQNYDMHNYAYNLSILQNLISIRQKVMGKLCGQKLQVNIPKCSNSACKYIYRNETRLQVAQQGMLLIDLRKCHRKLSKGYGHTFQGELFKDS